MARQGRVLLDGGVYHLISRGHNRNKLFYDINHYSEYMKCIRRYKKRFSFNVFHYCLMPNHIHILMRVAIGSELPHILQGINQSYANYYKRIFKTAGNIFQGRYKSIIVDNDNYLMECGRYIERNPIRAGIIKDLSDYKFSSYMYYVKGKKDDIITCDPCYIALSFDVKERMKLYSEYVLQNRPYESILDKSLKI